MQDPRSFTIPCTIRNHEFGKALCDSGASINLMPLSVVKRLSFGELTPITLSLRMVYRSMTQPKGILEDVLVKVGKFIFPSKFCGDKYGRTQASTTTTWQVILSHKCYNASKIP